MIDEKKLYQEEQIRAYAEIYARNLIMYGVDVREKLETVTQMSLALNQAYLRGRQDGCNREWIPCFDRLPVDGENVIACFCTGTVTELLYEGEGKFRGLYEYSKDVIIAWQPLPAPYKEDMRGGENE